MREILFRGKNKNNNWVYGKLLNHKRIITQSDEETEEMPCFDMCDYQEEVIENTIGQYTGLKDKNGKKIFEGDIVKDILGQVGQIVYKEKYSAFVVDKWELGYALWFDKKIEVISNIYDNPELIGE